MIPSPVFTAAAIAILAVVMVLVFFAGQNRGQNRLRPLAGLAFAFILAGILFGQDRLIGYGLMAVGVILAVVDIFYRSRSR